MKFYYIHKAADEIVLAAGIDCYKIKQIANQFICGAVYCRYEFDNGTYHDVQLKL